MMAPMKRAVPILAVLLLGGLLYYLWDDASGRSDRRGGVERGEDENRTRTGTDGDVPVTDGAALAKLIAKYGGLVVKGRAVLTRPEQPARTVKLVLRGTIADESVAVECVTGEAGAFAFPEVPRAGDFVITAGGDRIQPFEQRGLLPPGSGDLDAGELRLLRWYILRGRVVGAGGRGLKGAEVALVGSLGGGGGFSFMRMAQQASEKDPVLKRTEAAEDGSFELRLADPGRLTVRARKDGWAPHYRSNVVVGGVVPTELNLAMTRGYPVEGFVLDAAGRPVGEAAVTMWAGGRGPWSMTKEVTVTDGAGRFAFRVEPQAREYNASVAVGDHVNVGARFRVPLDNDLILRVPGGGALVGRIIDAETRQPVTNADVMVTFVKKSGSSMMMRMPDFTKVLRTDEYGRYRVTGLGNGQLLSVGVRVAGYADARLGAWMATDPTLWTKVSKLRLKPDAEVKMPDIPLMRGRVLEGQVKDKATEAPLAGATVEVSDFIMGNREVTTDANGTYRLDHVGDSVSMTVSVNGYAAHRDSPMRPQRLANEDVVRRDFALEPAGIVGGAVVTVSGDPVPHALVRLESAATGWGAWQLRAALRGLWTHADEKGRFEIPNVPLAKIMAQATAPGFDAGRSAPKTIRGDKPSTGMDVLMVAAARIEGMVRSRDRGPVANARVTVAKDPGKKADSGTQWRALSSGTIVFTDERGRFAVGDVPVGDVLVRVEAQGFATMSRRFPGVEPGQKISSANIDMAPAFTIEGKILDPDGKPYTMTWLRVRQTASPDGEVQAQLLGARIGPDGSFTVRDLAAGTYTIEVRISRFMQTEDGPPALKDLKREGIAAGTKGLILQLERAEE